MLEDILFSLSSSENYSKLSYSIKHIIHEESDYLVHIEAIRSILSNKSQPIQILLALRLTKELVDTHLEIVVLMIQESILPFIYKIAQFDSKNQDPDRGRYLYGQSSKQDLIILEREEQKIANSTLRLALECVQIWAAWYPTENDKPSQFAQRYRDLLQMGITYPKLVFFKISDIHDVFQLKNQGLAYSQLSLEEEISKWDEQNDKQKLQLICLCTQKMERNKFILLNDKLCLQYKAFYSRSKYLLEQGPENTDRQTIKQWVEFYKIYNNSLFRFKTGQLSMSQFKQFWSNYQESFLDFDEIQRDNLLEKKEANYSGQDLTTNQQNDKSKTSKPQVDTGQSSQQQIVTEPMFYLIVKEKDSLIDRLEQEKKLLLKKLEVLKLQLFELNKNTSTQSNHLLRLNQDNIQILKKEVDPEDL
ncbi:hypothetical protein pb186bvf_018984 [Paramecium bursaria]